jgi:hypothetical protein
VLWPAEFLTVAPGFEHALNQLQHNWAKSILGCRHAIRLNWVLAQAQCGWEFRLGTKAIEEAIMAVARLQVLPALHPAAVLYHICQASTAPAFLSHVRALMARISPGRILPGLLDYAPCASRALEAMACSAMRREVLSAYRWQVVRPAMRAYDEAHFHSSSAKELPGLGVSYNFFQASPRCLPSSLTSADLLPATICHFRTWALVRITGQWPLSAMGGEGLLEVLPLCSLCRSQDCHVLHALADCPGTLSTFFNIVSVCPGLRRDNKRALVYALFGAENDEFRRFHIHFVGEAVRQCWNM